MNKPLRLLIVEDSLDDAELLLYQLKESGYSVTHACVSSRAAMRAALAQETWDAIVSDYTLPQFSGPAALAELHASGQDLPFIVVSGTIDENIAVTAMKAGAHDFLMKDKLQRLAPAIEREVREAAVRRERRQAEEARRESDARYRDLFENAPISLWEQDFSAVKQRLETLRADGVVDFKAFFEAHPEIVAECVALVKIIDVNSASLKLYHAASKTQLLAGLSQIISPDSGPLFRDELCLIARGHTEYEQEGVNLTLTGERLDIDLHWSAAPGYEATLAKVLISVEDITARKRAERAAREAAAELQTVFEAIPDLFFRLDAQGAIHDYYAGREAQLFLPLEAFLGKRLAEVMPADIALDMQAAVAQAQRTCEIVTLEYALPAPQNTQSFEARFIPFLDQQIIVMVRNVSERKQMLAQVFNSQKLVDLGTLAAGVAHELNSPLQVITGLSESSLTRLKQGEFDQDRVKQNLETINRSGWRCAEIVRSLLTYARASTSQIQPYDLNVLVRDTLLLIEHQLRSWSNIAVNVELAPDLPLLLCDRNQITQILINLLTNARDAMPDGGEISIRTHHDPAAGCLVLQVSDIGTGIPEAIRHKIFDPFFTTKPSSQGTGLGLYIVAGIIRAYGGEITVDSVPGEGATFTLIFPEKAAPVEAPPEGQSNPE